MWNPSGNIVLTVQVSPQEIWSKGRGESTWPEMSAQKKNYRVHNRDTMCNISTLWTWSKSSERLYCVNIN